MASIPFFRWTLEVDKRAARIAAVFLAAALAMAGQFVTARANSGGAGASGSGGEVRRIAASQQGGSEGAGAGTEAGAGAATGEAVGAGDGAGIADAGTGVDMGSSVAGVEAGMADSGLVGAGGAPSSGASVGAGGNVSGTAPDGTPLSGAEYVAVAGADSGTSAESEKIYVYMTGAVKKPGVYELPRFSMIVDAVAVAGGFAPDADTDNVNLVYRLDSNAMLGIKRKPALAEGEPGSSGVDGQGPGDAAQPSGGDSADGGPRAVGNAVDITYNYDGVIFSSDGSRVGSPQGADGATSRMNINTASETELATLPGIGVALAKKIIEYRSGHNGFGRIEDIMNVSGIKQAKFDAIKEQITV